MNWQTKIGFILLFAIAFSVFMHRGWHKPEKAQAGLPPITSCAGCHGYSGYGFTDGTARNNPAGTFLGSHNKHVVTYSKVCSVCHVAPATETSVDFKHRNSNIQMKAGGTAIDGGYYDKNNNSAYDAGDDTFAQTNSPSLQTCRTVYCHSQGTSNTSNIGETRTTIATPLANLTWSSAGVCSSCHGNPPNYANASTTWGAAKSNNHTAATHASLTCDKCHNQTTTTGTSITTPANHTNKLYNVNPGSGVGLTYAYDVGGGSCSTISGPGGCHGNAQWGVTQIDCITCHSSAMDASDGAPTRRAITAEFSMAWSHKRTASTSATYPTAAGVASKYDCCVCHMEGDAATGAVNATYHKNNAVNLRDPDTGTAITAFTSFSRDTATATLESWVTNVQNNLCLKCHDALGAESALARVPGGTAMRPFGTAPSHTSGNNVLNVDAHFATTNASFHPVKGVQNNDLCDSDTMMSPWNQFLKTKDTQTTGNLISCWDCHVTLNTGHGGSATLRATYYPYITDGNVPLCALCHKATIYATAASGGATESAFGGGATGEAQHAGSRHTGADWNCTTCHGSDFYTTDVGRPTRSENVHGFDRLTTGVIWPPLQRAWIDMPTPQRPYAFLRNTTVFQGFRYRTIGQTNNVGVTDWGCVHRDTLYASCSNGEMQTAGSTDYTPGGSWPTYSPSVTAKATIAYRSNTGANTLSSPKNKTFGGAEWPTWTAESEMATAGSPVRWVQTAENPSTTRPTERIVATLSDDGNIDAYVWNGSAWTFYTNLASTGVTANAYKSFDIAYEKGTGRALLVYSRGVTTANLEWGYRIWNGASWAAEVAMDAPRTTGIINWVQLATAPGVRAGTGDDNEIAMIYSDANADVHGLAWTGSAWSEMGASAVWDATATIATEGGIAVAYEQVSGRAMFVWGDSVATDNYNRIWDGTTLSGPTLGPDIATQGGTSNQVVLKADPASNQLMFLAVDAGADLNTARWSGSAWTVHAEHDAAVDSALERCADFEWEPTGGKGLIVWGTAAGAISYKTFTPADTWGTAVSSTIGTGVHNWIQLRRNPAWITGEVMILGAVLEGTNFDLGTIIWDGKNFWIDRAGNVTLDTTVITYESFEISYHD